MNKNLKCWKCKKGNIDPDDSVTIAYKCCDVKDYFHGDCFNSLTIAEMEQLKQKRLDLALKFL